jgi:hypothetical protein
VQCSAEQSRAEKRREEQCSAEQSRAVQSRAEQCTAEQSSVEQIISDNISAVNGSAVQCRKCRMLEIGRRRGLTFTTDARDATGPGLPAEPLVVFRSGATGWCFAFDLDGINIIRKPDKS